MLLARHRVANLVRLARGAAWQAGRAVARPVLGAGL